jgi:hypothetical protein
MECKAVGTVAAADAERLCELLSGMSGYPVLPVRQHEVVLKAAPRGKQARELRLLHFIGEPSADGTTARSSDRRVPTAPCSLGSTPDTCRPARHCKQHFVANRAAAAGARRRRRRRCAWPEGW